jgi:gluconate 2-dehydrogenase
MKPVLAITRRVPPAFAETLAGEFELRIYDSVEPLRERLAGFLAGAQAAVLVPYDNIDASLLADCPSLKVVSNASAGFDNLDLAACTARGVLCTNAPDGVTNATADFAMGLLIACARKIPEGDATVRAGRWSASTYDNFMSPQIGGSTIGIFGMGRIGQAIARRASHGFGMQVLHSSRTPLPGDVEDWIKCRLVDKAELMRSADHIVVALPLSAQTKNFIGAPEIAAMRPGATLVNIGRGGVVDELALAAALHEGKLAAAALDVFEGEPRVRPELLQAPRLLLTPHIASATQSARLATLRQATENARAALKGRAPPNLLNPKALA